ncbi:hypothetical protein [Haloarcula litorea]|uniref:hypothetical protein n=1 Tax=Haloarcula litorea TaxID=3032579 RepID=UPI0023E7E447|nr:hypothetical protein [Halomicroarcula sp. GDY20]
MRLRHHSERAPRARGSKAALFCPGCSRESPVDGDWIADDGTARQRLLCPACGAVVIDQPTF